MQILSFFLHKLKSNEILFLVRCKGDLMLLLLKNSFFSFVQFTIENVNVMIIINLIIFCQYISEAGGWCKV